MHLFKFACFVVFLLVLEVRPSDQRTSFVRLLRLVGKSSDVADFAEVLQEFFGFGGSSDSTRISSTDVVRRIDQSMELTQTNILTSLLETSKLDRIYDTVIAMHSAMLDLRNLVLANGGPLAGTYRQRFIENYQTAQITKHLRFLPELLTYIVPGFDIPLLEQLKQNTKCNHTTIGVFRDFYVNLLSDGIGVQAAYFEFTTNITLATLLGTEWESSLGKVQQGFDGLEIHCFEELLREANQKSCPRTTPCPKTSGAWSKSASWLLSLATVFVLFV